MDGSSFQSEKANTSHGAANPPNRAATENILEFDQTSINNEARRNSASNITQTAASTSYSVGAIRRNESRSGTTRRRRRSPPPLNVLQQTVAHSMAQVIVNMTNAGYQETCRHLLQVDNLEHQAQARILQMLQQIEAKKLMAQQSDQH